jgi:hypothetical protein
MTKIALFLARRQNMTQTLSFLITLFVSVSFAHAQSYCLAIRGNGELAPAHWGGMAKIVETMGLPEKQAGGSSASISMFLLDAIASNPYVKNSNKETQKEAASLLLKSLQGYLLFIADSKEFKDVQLLFQQGQKLSQTSFMKDIKSISNQADLASAKASIEKIKSTLTLGIQLGIINGSLLSSLTQHLNALQSSSSTLKEKQQIAAQLQFSLSELYNTLSVFGQFNAESDANLFFRPGVVSFEGLALQFGRIANFLAQNEASENSLNAMNTFISQCSDIAKNKTWVGVLQSKVSCQQYLTNAISTYFSTENRKVNFSSKSIGQSILSYPTTAVLTKSAYAEAKKALSEYSRKLDSRFGQSFKLTHPEDIRFGYWGKNSNKISANLPTSDEKSRRFMSLGSASWKTALSLSPAEPGLSPFLEFEANKTPFISAGGWSDLHPVVVLKAAGCENVVYLNRRGGESMFAQGVAKRLLNFERSWELLKTKPTAPSDPENIGKINSIRNNTGDTSDMNSLWSNLYNMANPKSSYQFALQNADAVLCTDWNDFDIKSGPTEMIENAYNSSFYVPENSGLANIIDKKQQLDPTQMHADGYPLHVGCHP